MTGLGQGTGSTPAAGAARRDPGRARDDLIAGVVLLALAVGYGAMAGLVRARRMPGDIGARAVPLFLAGLLAALSLVMVCGSVRVLARLRRGTAGNAEAGRPPRAAEARARGADMRTALCLAMTLVYVIAMPAVGYVVATTAYMFAMMWAFRPGAAASAAGAAAATGTAVITEKGRVPRVPGTRPAWANACLLAAVAVTTSVALYLVFGRLLMVPVPKGRVFTWLGS